MEDGKGDEEGCTAVGVDRRQVAFALLKLSAAWAVYFSWQYARTSFTRQVPIQFLTSSIKMLQFGISLVPISVPQFSVWLGCYIPHSRITFAISSLSPP